MKNEYTIEITNCDDTYWNYHVRLLIGGHELWSDCWLENPTLEQIFYAAHTFFET